MKGTRDDQSPHKAVAVGDRGGAHPDSHLTALRLRRREVDELEHLGRSVSGAQDGFHQIPALRLGASHDSAAGCHSSTLFPSGSMTHANLPYSESSIFSRTLHPSSLSAATRA